jgi:hypothetical protein
MSERRFTLIQGEVKNEVPTQSAVQLCYEYFLDLEPLKFEHDLPYVVSVESADGQFKLDTILEDTNIQFPFSPNGVLVAVFVLKFADLKDKGVLGHERYELRQVKGSLDLYKRVVENQVSSHEHCTKEEKVLIQTALSQLNNEKEL